MSLQHPPENTSVRDYLLPSDFRAALMQYLSGRPYSEVAHAMAVLSQLEPLKHDPKL